MAGYYFYEHSVGQMPKSDATRELKFYRASEEQAGCSFIVLGETDTVPSETLIVPWESVDHLSGSCTF